MFSWGWRSSVDSEPEYSFGVQLVVISMDMDDYAHWWHCCRWDHAVPDFVDFGQVIVFTSGWVTKTGRAVSAELLFWLLSLRVRGKEILVIKTVCPIMTVFNDIAWTKKGKSNECFSNSEKVKRFGGKISFGTLVFSRSRRRTNIQSSDLPVRSGFLKKKGGRCTIDIRC